ncbi:hypothetical protein NM688_g7918 [Phlebia brevispora]|uniref:Uncharacterized protein n=1 Tax=Phlebia brevispora TaxID=194682 RepID=A0ACC1S049_9APHY|nr:hypothetical protein NM688_g7918 [Phlebia brevispora]
MGDHVDTRNELLERRAQLLQQKTDRDVELKRTHEELRAQYKRTLADMRDAYDSDICSLDHRISELSVHLNRSTLVARLPVELLRQIFIHFTVDFWKDNLYIGTRRAGPWYSRMAIAHVCHDWREVAMGIPYLWTWIRSHDCHPSYWRAADFAISHSGSLPLIVVFECGTRQCFTRILGELPRIFSLHLMVSDGTCDYLEALSSENLEAPMLEELSLDLQLNHRLVIPKLSTMELPRLRSLSVKGASVRHLPNLVRTTLTSLTVHKLKYRDLTSLLDVLSSVPALQDLDVRLLWEHLHETAPDFAPAKVAALPSLSTLHVVDGNAGTGIISLLTGITFPSSCKPNLHAFGIECSRGHATLLMQTLDVKSSTNARGRLSSTSRPHTVALSEYGDSNHPQSLQLYLGVWDDRPSVDILLHRSQWSRSPGTSFSLRASPNIMLLDILPNIDLSGVSCIYIHAYLEKTHWHKLSQAAPLLDTLYIGRNQPATSLDAFQDAMAFAESLSDDEGHGRAEMYFPALRTLVLQLVRRTSSRKPSYKATDVDTLTTVIISSLTARQSKCGKRLHSLNLKGAQKFEDVHLQRIADARIADVLQLDGVEYQCDRTALVHTVS